MLQMLKQSVLAAAALALCVPTANAQVFYEDYAADRSNSSLQLLAAGMMEGWGWANATLESEGQRKLYCWPRNTMQNAQSALAILDSYALTAPQEVLDLPLGLVLLDAVQDRFPC